MSTVAFIPARGGSKGVPGKNIKNINGKPLICWTIEQALSSPEIDSVVVSTDSQEIADIAMKSGAQVPYIRPEFISGDEATTESAMLHFCDYLKNNQLSYDNIMLLQATSPIRGVNRISNFIQYFERNSYDSVLSVSQSHRFFWKNKAVPSASYDYLERPRRQDIKDEDISYMETGSIYMTRLEKFVLYKNRLCGRVGLYETPEEESYEIDTYLDFSICETILKNYQG